MLEIEAAKRKHIELQRAHRQYESSLRGVSLIQSKSASDERGATRHTEILNQASINLILRHPSNNAL